MICVFAIFHHFLNIFFFDSLDFHLDSTQIFKCMTRQSIFLLFCFFFILTIGLLRATMHAIDDLPSRNISSHVRIVLKGWPFGPKLFISFLSKERIMAQKCSRETGNFGSTCPKASIKDDFRVSQSWNFVFLVLEKV